VSSAKFTNEQAVAAITALVNDAPRKPSTVEEIAKVHAEFWAQRDPPAPKLDEMEVRKANIQAAHRHMKSLEQSARASKSRPKKKPSHRIEVIEAMRIFNYTGATLQAFLDSAAVESIEGITITRVASSKIDAYSVECDDIDSRPREVKYRTLEDWWTEAAKTI
jgi:hypothetical protein